MRLTFGRNLFEDIIGRQHAIEFSYLGLNSWNSNAVANGPENYRAVNLAPASVVAIPGLYSPFPQALGGFNALFVPNGTFLPFPSFYVPADTNILRSTMVISERSTFNNFEVSYRISRLPRPDRVAQLADGSWIQVGTPTLVPSLLGGLRIFTFNDHFSWASSGVRPNGVAYSGLYNISSSNVW